ncbi:hypothetical protein GCM10011376_13250 [Nocardioides flavus (ex Wang et al. 2016)]|uniref:DUF732 domain-containing protein n=1 Tax=Nocardioides flavus (ex Wang et al. 2016) TaxID=2058780 RepID=A0ABQ3HGH7_9ACTN|nr:hypothetical protein [Nocardioides flavus (ex Wang et al. 2016)]GHE16715.1 hypothetical protein GCM10011376_13250 [Nocardioides flavus (ex Wang et al. 2016)]
MATPADRIRSWPTSRIVLALGVLALVVLIGVVQRPAGDAPAGAPEPAGAPATPAETATAPSAPAVATDEDFCAGFRALADSQAQYVAGSIDEAALEASADALVDTGVPAGMSLPARSGYHTLIGSVYDSIGLSLEPGAVGATREPVAGGDAAFSAYLQQSCPP